MGPDSSLGPLIAAILILVAVAKLGFIADLISKPTMIGYLNGLALTILVGQPPKLFGFKTDAEALNARGISLVFAELKDPVREKSSATGSPAPLTRGTSSRPLAPPWARSGPKPPRR